MRYEFAELHRQLGTTTVYVTHDQVEAMTLADRIIVMGEGRIEQVGTPRELYARPANIFVAQFLGTPRMNILPATMAGEGRAMLADGRDIALPPLAAARSEEHTSELQSLMRISYAVFCLKKTKRASTQHNPL